MSREYNESGYKYKVERNKQISDEYKKHHPCQICGESRIPCLDFHHSTGTKESSITDLVYKHKSVKRLKDEMSKCIVVCANCHRIIHSR